MADKFALQQVNPELGNMQRQIEHLKHLSELPPSEANAKRAIPYINALCQNISTVFLHFNGFHLPEANYSKFGQVLEQVLKEAELSEAEIVTDETKITIEGIFDLRELVKSMIVAQIKTVSHG